MTPIGIRENNPFDVSLPIQGWHGPGTVHGAPGQGGFASFPDMATGFAAGVHRINNYIDAKGYKTISLMGEHYATDPRWADSVSKSSGIPLHAPLSTADKEQMGELYKGILLSELGPRYANPIIKEFILGKAPTSAPNPGPVLTGTSAVLTGAGAIIQYLQTEPSGQALTLVLAGIGILFAAMFARWKSEPVTAAPGPPAAVSIADQMADLIRQQQEIYTKMLALEPQLKAEMEGHQKLLDQIHSQIVVSPAPIAPPQSSPPQ